ERAEALSDRNRGLGRIEKGCASLLQYITIHARERPDWPFIWSKGLQERASSFQGMIAGLSRRREWRPSRRCPILNSCCIIHINIHLRRLHCKYDKHSATSPPNEDYQPRSADICIANDGFRCGLS